MTVIAERPGPAQPDAWEFPDVDRKVLPSGLQVALCHTPGRPFLFAYLLFDRGSADESTELAGVTQLTGSHVMKASERLDYVSLGLAFERLGVFPQAGASWHTLGAGLYGPGWTFNEGTPLLREVLQGPGFPADEVTKDIEARKVMMGQRVNNPGALAGRAFNEAVFSGDTVYQRESEGTWGSLAKLDRELIADTYQQTLKSAPATLIVVGDLDLFDALSFAESLGDSWTPQGRGPAPTVVARNEGPRIVLVNRPGSEQSVIIGGHAGPPSDIPERVAIGTFTHAFGGHSHSRLSRVLREEKGFTYGVGAGFNRMRYGGTFGIQTSVQNDATAPTCAEIAAQLRAVHADGLTQAEFDESKEARIGHTPLQFQNVQGLMGLLSSIVEDDLPANYASVMYETLNTHTVDDANEVATKYLDPDNLTIVVVGDASVVQADLEACGVGPVEVREAADVFPPNPDA